MAFRSMRAPRTAQGRGSARARSANNPAIGIYDQCWPHDYAFKDRFRLVDYGGVVSFPGRTEDMVAAVEETVSNLVDRNVATLDLGGDHLTSYPPLRRSEATSSRSRRPTPERQHCGCRCDRCH